MSVSNEFIAYVLDLFSDWGDTTARKMFGGAGLYKDSKMFGLIADDVVYLKVDDTNREDFVQAGSSAFKPYPDEVMSMSYFEVPPDVLEESKTLIEWAKRSLDIQKNKK